MTVVGQALVPANGVVLVYVSPHAIHLGYGRPLGLVSVRLRGVGSRHREFKGCPVYFNQDVRAFGSVGPFLVDPFVQGTSVAGKAA